MSGFGTFRTCATLLTMSVGGGKADLAAERSEVRKWHFSDLTAPAGHVCYRGANGPSSDASKQPSIARGERKRENLVSSSVMTSARKSWLASPDKLAKGSTTMEKPSEGFASWSGDRTGARPRWMYCAYNAGDQYDCSSDRFDARDAQSGAKHRRGRIVPLPN